MDIKTICRSCRKSSEEKFREFFDIAQEGICILDATTGQFTQCNANARTLLGYSDRDLIGKTPSDISPEFQPDGLPSHQQACVYIEKAFSGQPCIFEWLIRRGDGKEVLFEVRLVRSNKSKVPELYSSFVDITERKEAEAHLKIQNQRLLEIAELQSHQVRKPLASLLGLINLYNFKNIYDPENPEVLQHIKKTAEMFDEVISQIVMKTHELKKITKTGFEKSYATETDEPA